MEICFFFFCSMSFACFSISFVSIHLVHGMNYYNLFNNRVSKFRTRPIYTIINCFYQLRQIHKNLINFPVKKIYIKAAYYFLCQFIIISPTLLKVRLGLWRETNNNVTTQYNIKNRANMDTHVKHRLKFRST